MNYQITNLGSGWYDFSSLPQEKSYIKIHSLCCETDRRAVNQAKKIIHNKNAVISIVKKSRSSTVTKGD